MLRVHLSTRGHGQTRQQLQTVLLTPPHGAGPAQGIRAWPVDRGAGFRVPGKGEYAGHQRRPTASRERRGLARPLETRRMQPVCLSVTGVPVIARSLYGAAPADL